MILPIILSWLHPKKTVMDKNCWYFKTWAVSLNLMEIAALSEPFHCLRNRNGLHKALHYKGSDFLCIVCHWMRYQVDQRMVLFAFLSYTSKLKKVGNTYMVYPRQGQEDGVVVNEFKVISSFIGMLRKNPTLVLALHLGSLWAYGFRFYLRTILLGHIANLA